MRQYENNVARILAKTVGPDEAYLLIREYKALVSDSYTSSHNESECADRIEVQDRTRRSIGDND